MKKKILLSGVIAFLSAVTFSLSAQHCGGGGHDGHSSTSSHIGHSNQQLLFQVEGNCNMCKKRIESAALLVPGVTDAQWSADTHFVTVSFEGEVSKTDVQRAIARAGHDTEGLKAEDKTYKSLPACCQYDRK